MTVLLVCSMGGHLVEMRCIEEAFAGQRTVLVTYDSPVTRALAGAHLLGNFGLNPLRYAWGLVQAARILRKERPRLIVSTGSEIALPFFALARVRGIPTVFVESLTRVHRLSGTGRLLLPLADRFYVQWPQLARRHPKALFRGALL